MNKKGMFFDLVFSTGFMLIFLILLVTIVDSHTTSNSANHIEMISQENAFSNSLLEIQAHVGSFFHTHIQTADVNSFLFQTNCGDNVVYRYTSQRERVCYQDVYRSIFDMLQFTIPLVQDETLSSDFTVIPSSDFTQLIIQSSQFFEHQMMLDKPVITYHKVSPLRFEVATPTDLYEYLRRVSELPTIHVSVFECIETSEYAEDIFFCDSQGQRISFERVSDNVLEVRIEDALTSLLARKHMLFESEFLDELLDLLAE